MLPLDLFHSRDFAGANLLTLVLYAAFGGALFFLPLNLIQVQGYSATAAGAAFLPFVVIMFTLSRWSGGLVDRFGSRLPLSVGPVIAATGFALLALPRVSSNYWTSFFPAIVILGVGMAISVAPLTTTVMNAVGEEQAGVASGINNAVARTASLLAIAIFGILMLQMFSSTLADRLNDISVGEEVRRSIYEQRVKLAGIGLPPNLTSETQSQIEQVIADSFVSGFRLIMFVATGLALGGGVISWLMITPTKETSRGTNTYATRI
jgi:MFS family permease